VTATPHAEVTVLSHGEPALPLHGFEQHWPVPGLQPALHELPSFPHCPELLHSCGCDPLQRRAPGVHTPTQALVTHAWFEQALCTVPQAPAESQVT